MPDASTLRRTWRLGNSGGRCVVVRRIDLLEDEKFYEAPFYVTSQLGRWLSDPFVRSMLLDIGQALFGWTSGADSQLKARLEEAFRSGRLVMLQEERGWSSSGGGESGGGGDSSSFSSSAPAPLFSPPAPGGGGSGAAPAKPKTWIQIKLVDQDNKAVPNERYKLKITDGTIREGRLGADGTVFESGIDPGNCEISFPDLHEKDWVAIP